MSMVVKFTDCSQTGDMSTVEVSIEENSTLDSVLRVNLPSVNRESIAVSLNGVNVPNSGFSLPLQANDRITVTAKGIKGALVK